MLKKTCSLSDLGESNIETSVMTELKKAKGRNEGVYRYGMLSMVYKIPDAELSKRWELWLPENKTRYVKVSEVLEKLVRDRKATRHTKSGAYIYVWNA